MIDWVMRAEGVSFRLAVELLREDSPSLAASFSTKYQGKRKGPVAASSTAPKLGRLVERSADDDVLMRQVVDYYHATLKESPEALTYLQRRGPEIRGDDRALQVGLREQDAGVQVAVEEPEGGGAEIRGQLATDRHPARERARAHDGLARNPHLRRGGARDGDVRAEDHGTPAGGHAVPLYLPGPHGGCGTSRRSGSSKQMILCEALIDALTFWCAGFRHVTASYGVEGFTDDHLAAFRKHGTERVLDRLRPRRGGGSSGQKLAEKLTSEGIECFRVLFPRGMDANEYALKDEPAAGGCAAKQ